MDLFIPESLEEHNATIPLILKIDRDGGDRHGYFSTHTGLTSQGLANSWYMIHSGKVISNELDYMNLGDDKNNATKFVTLKIDPSTRRYSDESSANLAYETTKVEDTLQIFICQRVLGPSKNCCSFIWCQCQPHFTHRPFRCHRYWNGMEWNANHVVDFRCFRKTNEVIGTILGLLDTTTGRGTFFESCFELNNWQGWPLLWRLSRRIKSWWSVLIAVVSSYNWLIAVVSPHSFENKKLWQSEVHLLTTFYLFRIESIPNDIFNPLKVIWYSSINGRKRRAASYFKRCQAYQIIFSFTRSNLQSN